MVGVGRAVGGTLAAAVIAVGCGGADRPELISARKVADAFEARGFGVVVGKRFRLPGILKSTWTPIYPDAATRDALGDFHIAVHDDEEAARSEGSLAPEPQKGVRWSYTRHDDRDGGSWTASKEYGNVRLAWYPGRKNLDARWRRLDAILSSLVGPA